MDTFDELTDKYDRMTREERRHLTKVVLPAIRKASGHRFPGEGTGKPIRVTEESLNEMFEKMREAWPVLRDAGEIVAVESGQVHLEDL